MRCDYFYYRSTLIINFVDLFCTLAKVLTRSNARITDALEIGVLDLEHVAGSVTHVQTKLANM